MVKYFKWININNKQVINESDWSMTDPNRIDKLEFFPTLNDVLVIKAQLSSTRRSNSYSTWSIWVIITRFNNLTSEFFWSELWFFKAWNDLPRRKDYLQMHVTVTFFNSCVQIWPKRETEGINRCFRPLAVVKLWKCPHQKWLIPVKIGFAPTVAGSILTDGNFYSRKR